jgi:hypothetical protein
MTFAKKYELQLPIPELTGERDQQLKACQISSGKLVTIHLLAGGYSGPNHDLLSDAAALPSEYRNRFLEIGDFQGMPFVVTEPGAVPTTIREWIPEAVANVRSGIVSAGLAEPSAQPPSDTPGPGEFTRMMRTGKDPDPPPQTAKPEIGEFTRLMKSTPAESQPPSPPVTPSVPAAAAEPGDFTRMMRSVSDPPQKAPTPRAVAPLTSAPAPPPVSAPIPTATSGVGEFTRMLRAASAGPATKQPEIPVPAEAAKVNRVIEPDPLAPTAPIAEAQPASALDPHNEATRLYPIVLSEPTPSPQSASPVSPLDEWQQMLSSTPARGASIDIPAARERIQTPQSDFPDLPDELVEEKKSPPGEFTRMMEAPLPKSTGKPSKPSTQPAGPIKAKSLGEFTRMMEASSDDDAAMPDVPAARPTGQPVGEATRAFAVKSAPAPAASSAETGPSEFTRIFQTPAKPAEPKEAKAPAKQARVVPKKKKKTSLLLWLLIGSALLLVIALVLYFTLS